MRNLVHDRTVRVAEDGSHDPNADVSSSQYGGSDPEDLLGFISFDAREDTVHVTQLDGTSEACERLLAEPVRFAERESMAVEVLAARDATPSRPPPRRSASSGAVTAPASTEPRRFGFDSSPDQRRTTCAVIRASSADRQPSVRR